MKKIKVPYLDLVVHDRDLKKRLLSRFETILDHGRIIDGPEQLEFEQKFANEIGVKYATTRVGKFTKTITLTTNASKKPVILTIKGEVNPPAKEETVPERKTKGSPVEKK